MTNATRPHQRRPRPDGNGGHRRPRRGRPQTGTGGPGTGDSTRSAPSTLSEPAVPALAPVSSFDALDMPAPLLATLTRQGLHTPSPIQMATLPNSLAGRDVLGRARTGSGKTLAFGLAALARLNGQQAEPGEPLALVLVPTRELALQVTDALVPYARSVRARLAAVVGGMPIGRQAGELRRGAELVVATPGRLRDLVERGDCRLDQVRIAVLDEADQMADMGFLPQVTAILRQIRTDGQRMLFSATLDRNVDSLVRRFLRDPTVHSVDPSAGAVTTMEHHLLHVSDADKRATATHIAAREGQVIMFLKTKRAVDRMAAHLRANGVHAAPLHGGRSQSQRTRTLEQFKSGSVTALVATNVAARGIHVEGLDLVVNVDPPADHKDYLHRGGRTARAGESGSVVTLVLPEQRREMAQLISKAQIDAHSARVVPGDSELTRVTGARAPSGVPVAAVAEPSTAPASRGARRRPQRRGGRRA